MKKYGSKVCCILLICFFITGCSLGGDPSTFIKPPKSKEKQLEMKHVIEKFLPQDTTLTVPLTKDKISAYNEADLDGDGLNELIVFYKNIHNDMELGFLVLKKVADNWSKLGNINEYGKDIDFFDLEDITGDNISELLIGWSGGSGANRLAIYTMDNKTIKQIKELRYAGLAVGDLDDDAKPDIALNYRDEKAFIPVTVVELYKYLDGEVNLWDKKELEGYPGPVIVGSASKEKKGIFVDLGLGAHSAITYLLVLKDNKMEIILGDQEKEPITFKPYPLPSKDVDGDGIIEIGIQKEPPSTEQLAMVEIPWIEEWYKWNGDNGLIWAKETYTQFIRNRPEGYQFEIPKSWRDQFTISKTYKEDTKITTVEFYYLQGVQKTNILTIISLPEEMRAAKELELNKNKIEYTVLEKNQGYVHIAILPAINKNITQVPKQILLEPDEVKEKFKLFNLD